VRYLDLATTIHTHCQHLMFWSVFEFVSGRVPTQPKLSQNGPLILQAVPIVFLVGILLLEHRWHS